MRILVADDDSTLRSELAELLEEDGHEVWTVADGEEALEALQSAGFDVALLDLMMPRATGLEVLHRLRAGRRGTPVVMITGHGSIDVAVEAMKAGAIDFIVKPFEYESIQRILRGVEDEARVRRVLEGGEGGTDGLASILAAASARKALLVIVGPGARVPNGANRVLRLEGTPRTPDVLSPSQLYEINAAVEDHLGKAETPVVYAAGLRILEEVHGRDDLRAWIRHVSQTCARRGGTLVLAGIDPLVVSDLETEIDMAALEPGIQGMLESLANPIRRAIVSYLSTSGPVAYSSILKMNFVDSSSKLSFHLQKLQSDHLLMKAEGGAYVLTDKGRRAWLVVRALADGRAHPTLLLEAGSSGPDGDS